MQLHKEVFSHQEFVKESQQSFVLVELDFPSDRASQPDSIATQNNDWSQRFDIESFPTVVLTDSQGRPYAKTGYRPDGWQPYLEHLAKLREKRQKRDDAFARADQASGVEKARLLDEGLRAVGAEFALTAYRDVVDQILTLDSGNEGGLKSRYQEFLARRQVGKEIQQLMACYQPGLETEYISRIRDLERKFQPKGRLQTELRGVLAQLYIQAKQPASAIQIADQVLAKDVHPKTKLQWRIMKAVALGASRQVDEAFSVIDDISRDHSDNQTIVAACVGQKAQIMVENQRLDDAHAIVKDAIAKMTPGEARNQMEKMLSQIESRMPTSLGG